MGRHLKRRQARHERKERERKVRRRKNLAHAGILGLILFALMHEGASMADWLFLSLAAAVEVY